MSAAAILSRKLDSTKIITSSTRAPFQSSGRKCGSRAGTLLASKCFDSKAKPRSNPSRFASSTHSCPRCDSQPANPGPSANGERAILNSEITAKPATAIANVCRWKSAMPARVSAKRMKSIGMPATAGGSTGAPQAAIGSKRSAEEGHLTHQGRTEKRAGSRGMDAPEGAR